MSMIADQIDFFIYFQKTYIGEISEDNWGGIGGKAVLAKQAL